MYGARRPVVMNDDKDSGMQSIKIITKEILAEEFRFINREEFHRQTCSYNKMQ